MQSIEFVVAAYVLTWVVLGGYAAYVWRRFVRAERALRAEEAPRHVTARAGRPGHELGGAA